MKKIGSASFCSANPLPRTQTEPDNKVLDNFLHFFSLDLTAAAAIEALAQKKLL